jgi:hypothetical protein
LPNRQRQLLRVEMASDDDGYECRFCGEVFPSGRALGGHTNKHTRKRSLGEAALPPALRARITGPPAPPPPPPPMAAADDEDEDEDDDEDEDEDEDEEDEDEDAKSWTSELAAADAAAAARGDLTPSPAAAARALKLRANSKEARYLRHLHGLDMRIGAGSHLAATFVELAHVLHEAEAASPVTLFVAVDALASDISFEFHRRVLPPGAPVVKQWERKRLCHLFAAQEMEDRGGWGWCGREGVYSRRSLVMDLDSPDLPSGANAVAPPVPLDGLYKGSWELASPAQVRAKGARIRLWATRVLGRWAAMPLPPIPLQSWEFMLLMRVRHVLSMEYRGFKDYLDYPMRSSTDRTVKLKDGAVVRVAPAGHQGD